MSGHPARGPSVEEPPDLTHSLGEASILDPLPRSLHCFLRTCSGQGQGGVGTKVNKMYLLPKGAHTRTFTE